MAPTQPNPANAQRRTEPWRSGRFWGLSDRFGFRLWSGKIGLCGELCAVPDRDDANQFAPFVDVVDETIRTDDKFSQRHRWIFANWVAALRIRPDSSQTATHAQVERLHCKTIRAADANKDVVPASGHAPGKLNLHVAVQGNGRPNFWQSCRSRSSQSITWSASLSARPFSMAAK